MTGRKALGYEERKDIMLEDLKPRLGELQEKLDQMGESLEVPAKEEKIAELEYKMGEPTLWAKCPVNSFMTASPA